MLPAAAEVGWWRARELRFSGNWGACEAPGSLGGGHGRVQGLETPACPICLPWGAGSDALLRLETPACPACPPWSLRASGPSFVEVTACLALAAGRSRGPWQLVGGRGPPGAACHGLLLLGVWQFPCRVFLLGGPAGMWPADVPRPAAGVAMWAPGRLHGGLVHCLSHPGR